MKAGEFLRAGDKLYRRYNGKLYKRPKGIPNQCQRICVEDCQPGQVVKYWSSVTGSKRLKPEDRAKVAKVFRA